MFDCTLLNSITLLSLQNCNMAIIVPIHCNKPNITYLLVPPELLRCHWTASTATVSLTTWWYNGNTMSPRGCASVSSWKVSSEWMKRKKIKVNYLMQSACRCMICIAKALLGVVFSLNMLNCFKEYKRYIHVLNCILDLAWGSIKCTLEQQYMFFALHSQYHACWCSSDLRSQSINRHGIDPRRWNIPSPASEELTL